MPASCLLVKHILRGIKYSVRSLTAWRLKELELMCIPATIFFILFKMKRLITLHYFLCA